METRVPEETAVAPGWLRGRALARFLGLCLATTAGLWAFGHYVMPPVSVGIDVADEKCLPYSVYFMREFEGQRIVRDEFVAFDFPGMPGVYKPNRKFMKKVAGVAGDQIRKTDGGIWVGPEFYPYSAKVMDKLVAAGRFPVGIRGGVIPEGFVFLVGTNPNSFDGRYYGLVEIKAITHKARPLW